jgi:hypothetical protein
MAEIFCISKQIKRSFDRLDFQIIKSIFIDCFIYGNNSVIIRFISELFIYIQSAKILLLSSKYEIIMVLSKLSSFQFAITILDFSVLLPI